MGSVQLVLGAFFWSSRLWLEGWDDVVVELPTSEAGNVAGATTTSLELPVRDAMVAKAGLDFSPSSSNRLQICGL